MWRLLHVGQALQTHHTLQIRLRKRCHIPAPCSWVTPVLLLLHPCGCSDSWNHRWEQSSRKSQCDGHPSSNLWGVIVSFEVPFWLCRSLILHMSKQAAVYLHPCWTGWAHAPASHPRDSPMSCCRLGLRFWFLTVSLLGAHARGKFTGSQTGVAADPVDQPTEDHIWFWWPSDWVKQNRESQREAPLSRCRWSLQSNTWGLCQSSKGGGKHTFNNRWIRCNRVWVL